MSQSSKRIRSRKQQKKAQQRRRTMAVVMGVVGLAIVGIAALLLTRSGTPANYTPEYAGGPRLALEQDSYDYGYVQLGTTITTDVKIENVGDEPLKISEIPVVEVREGC